MMEPAVLLSNLDEDRIRMIEKRENAHHRKRSEFNYNCVIAMIRLGVTNMMDHVIRDLESKNEVRYGVCSVTNAHSMAMDVLDVFRHACHETSFVECQKCIFMPIPSVHL